MTKVSKERKCVGHYMLGKTIGEGAFGKVWLAIHQPTGGKVNFKTDIKSNSHSLAHLFRISGGCKNNRKTSNARRI